MLKSNDEIEINFIDKLPIKLNLTIIKKIKNRESFLLLRNLLGTRVKNTWLMLLLFVTISITNIGVLFHTRQ